MIQPVAGSPQEQVCGGCDGATSIDVQDQGEVIDVGPWETGFYGGILLRLEVGGYREASETYVGGKGWETSSGQNACWVSNAAHGLQGNVHGEDEGTRLGRPSAAEAEVSVAHPSLGLLD